MAIDISKLLFIQLHLKDVDLNDPDTATWLIRTAKKTNKDRQKDHDELMSEFRDKTSKLCSSVEELQEATIDHLEDLVSDLFEEAALYKAVSLYFQVQLDVAKRIIEERQLKERKLHVVKG